MNWRTLFKSAVGCSLLFTGIAVPNSGLLDSDGGHFDRTTGEYHFHRQRSTSRLPVPIVDADLKTNKTAISMDGCFKIEADKTKTLKMYSSYRTDSKPVNLRQNAKFKVVRTATILGERWYGIRRLDESKPESCGVMSSTIGHLY